MGKDTILICRGKLIVKICMVQFIIILALSGVVAWLACQYISDNKDPVLPYLSRAPDLSSVGKSFAILEWSSKHEGDGPVCGYIVNLKHTSEDFKPVGFVPGIDVSDHQSLTFVIDRLQAHTEYMTTITLLHCSGKRGPPSPELYVNTSDFELPTLSRAPELSIISTSYAEIQWHSDPFSGDGPVCGYDVNIRNSDHEEPLSSVGFVTAKSFSSMTADSFRINDLDPSTEYEVVVGVIHCDGGRRGELRPSASFRTLDIVLPTLVEPPAAHDIGTSHVDITWSGQYEGDGPVCGYAINIRQSLDGRDGLNEAWSSVGFVPAGDLPLYFNVTNVEPGTSYEIAVVLVYCGSGNQGPPRPLLAVNTSVAENPSTVIVPSLCNISSPNMVTASGSEPVTEPAVTSVLPGNFSHCPPFPAIPGTAIQGNDIWKWLFIALAAACAIIVGLIIVWSLLHRRAIAKEAKETEATCCQVGNDNILSKRPDFYPSCGNDYQVSTITPSNDHTYVDISSIK